MFCHQDIFLAKKLSWQLIVECAQVHNFLDVKNNAHKMGQTDARRVINLNLGWSVLLTYRYVNLNVNQGIAFVKLKVQYLNEIR